MRKIVWHSGSMVIDQTQRFLCAAVFSWNQFHEIFSWKWFHGKIDKHGDLPEFWIYKRILLLPWNQSQSFIFCSFIKIRHWMVFRRTEFYFKKNKNFLTRTCAVATLPYNNMWVRPNVIRWRTFMKEQKIKLLLLPQLCVIANNWWAEELRSKD